MMKYFCLVALLFLIAYCIGDNGIPDRSDFPDETNDGRKYCMYAAECKSSCGRDEPFYCSSKDNCIVIKASKVHESEYEDFVKIDTATFGVQLIRARIDPKTKELCLINASEDNPEERCHRPFQSGKWLYLYMSTPAGSRMFYMHFVRTKGGCDSDDYGVETIREKAPHCM